MVAGSRSEEEEFSTGLDKVSMSFSAGYGAIFRDGGMKLGD